MRIARLFSLIYAMTSMGATQILTARIHHRQYFNILNIGIRDGMASTLPVNRFRHSRDFEMLFFDTQVCKTMVRQLLQQVPARAYRSVLLVMALTVLWQTDLPIQL